MKITRLDIESSLRAHFDSIGKNARLAECSDFNAAESVVEHIQETLDSIKERIEVGKRIGKGDGLEPVITFQSENVK